MSDKEDAIATNGLPLVEEDSESIHTQKAHPVLDLKPTQNESQSSPLIDRAVNHADLEPGEGVASEMGSCTSSEDARVPETDPSLERGQSTGSQETSTEPAALTPSSVTEAPAETETDPNMAPNSEAEGQGPDNQETSTEPTVASSIDEAPAKPEPNPNLAPNSESEGQGTDIQDTSMGPTVLIPSSIGDASAKPPCSPGPPEGLLAEPEPLRLSPVYLAPAEQLWSTASDQAVKLRMEESGPGSEAPQTIHQMFLEAVESHGDHPALGFKKEGVWVTLTWREYYERCRAAAKSFLKLGLERYHGVGILGFNSPEWFMADVGAILAGGLSAGIYTTNSPEACQYVAENCEANVLVVENHKQLLKILQIKDQLPHLKAIVQYKDELQQKLPNLYTWAEFMSLGAEVSDEHLDAVIASQKANECCSLIYTSGTTGTPKGVMLSHDNITWISKAAGDMPRLIRGEEVLVSYLPLSHVAAQVNDLWVCMKFVGTTYFADPDALKGSLGATLKEVRPTSFLGVPRVWEKMQEKMKAVGAKSSPLRKRVADWAKSIGLQYNYSVMNGENSVPWGFMLANNLVFKRVHGVLGLDRCRGCYTGAAPITKDTLEYFMSLNLPLYEVYGMSESTGPHTFSCAQSYHITSCGKVVPGCKTKLDKPDEDGNGEICFWGRHVFMGYLRMPDKTEEALDADGWLHSGDLGKHDKNGNLFITGRIKELIITAGGENIPPVPIEDAVKAEASIISNAMLIGDKLKFLSMLLTLKCVVDDNAEPTDELTPEVVEFCESRGVNATKVSEIIANKEPAIYTAIQEAVERVNARSTSNAQKVQKWVILERDFSISGGELGPTMKLRRPVVVKMYQNKIDELYGVAQE